MFFDKSVLALEKFKEIIMNFVVLKPDLGPLVRIELALVSYFMNFSAWK